MLQFMCVFRMTFGPGSSRHHPWTGRHDGGINSRLGDGKRGDQIYYIGVIDILQQYNASKRFETVFKVLNIHLLFKSFILLMLSYSYLILLLTCVCVGADT
jgi:hypothetical protein